MSNILTIDLGEGFERTTVVVRVDGREVLRDEVSTRRQIGLARRVEIDVATAKVRVDVELPVTGVRGELSLDVGSEPFVTVALGAGGLSLRGHSQPPHYI